MHLFMQMLKSVWYTCVGCTSFIMILISVQVCAGVKVLRDWGILLVNSECLINAWD